MGGLDFKDPPLISCILRQLQKMDAETLREVYAAVSRISDRGKKGY